jgi:hypothetical protein
VSGRKGRNKSVCLTGFSFNQCIRSTDFLFPQVEIVTTWVCTSVVCFVHLGLRLVDRLTVYPQIILHQELCIQLWSGPQPSRIQLCKVLRSQRKSGVVNRKDTLFSPHCSSSPCRINMGGLNSELP